MPGTCGGAVGLSSLPIGRTFPRDDHGVISGARRAGGEPRGVWARRIGGSMARSVGFAAGAGARRLRVWTQPLAALKRRVLETLGFGLLLAALLLAAALFSYRPQDPSLDTAAGAAVRNLRGRDGAVPADILRQSLGLAAFVIP